MLLIDHNRYNTWRTSAQPVIVKHALQDSDMISIEDTGGSSGKHKVWVNEILFFTNKAIIFIPNTIITFSRHCERNEVSVAIHKDI